MAEIIEFEFEDNTYQCDVDACKSYRVLRGLALASEDVTGFFAAAMSIFGGNDVKYAEQVGSMDKFGELVVAAVKAAGAKNS